VIDMSNPLERDIEERMRALTPDAYRRLGVRPPEPNPDEIVLKVAPPPSDSETEALLASLMIEAALEAKRSFELARRANGSVGLRAVFTDQAAKLCKATAMLSLAIDRRRNGGRLTVCLQHVKAPN
jgi:hypothetical protein